MCEIPSLQEPLLVQCLKKLKHEKFLCSGSKTKQNKSKINKCIYILEKIINNRLGYY